VRTLATISTTLCAAVVSLVAATAAAACSSGGEPQNAGDRRGEVNAMSDNPTNRVEGGATTSDNSASRNANDARPDATAEAPAQKSQLDFSARIRREASGEIVVEYSVTNRGARTVLLLNRGDTSLGLGPGRVYVEPQADGTVDLTQRGYTLPRDYGGPGPSV
jgi:hypothetical protein